MNQTETMLKRLNDVLPRLILGILVYGACVEFGGVWFVTDKLRYTTGLAIGIALAVGMAIHMAVVLQDAVDLYGGSGAQRRIVAKSVFRYLVVVIVFFVMMKWNLGNLVMAFVGVLGLKVSAYLQPLADKFILKRKERGGVSSDSDDIESFEKEVKM